MSHDQLKSHTDAELWRDAKAAFAARDFFEVHEQLEELWRRVPPAEKDPVQGLLQAAVCLHHYIRGNFSGARILVPQAVEKLSRSPAVYRGVELAEYLVRFRTTTAPLVAPGGATSRLNKSDAPLPRTATTNGQ